MRAKVLVNVDREAALNAIRALDALSGALNEQNIGWPKKLRRKYAQAREDLAHAIGQWGFHNGVSGLAE